jgi:predicted branched-subunit amino acid permease
LSYSRGHASGTARDHVTPSAAATFTRAGVRRGLLLAQPLTPGVLYGAAIQPWLAQATPRQALGTLFFLGDSNWALSMRHHQHGERDAGFILGSGVAMFAPWVGGTLLGFFLGNVVPAPATFGLDFMLVAFAAAIGISVWPGRAGIAPAAAAAVVALALHKLLPGGWAIVGAGLAAGLTGAWRHGR